MAVERTDDNETGAQVAAPDASASETVVPGTAASEAPDPKIAAAVAAAEAAGPQSGETVRVDSWIWSVRLAKTRSAGATACRGGHVRVNGERVKPAHSLRVGDEVRVRQEGWERVVIVKRLIRKRVGAPVAAQCYVDNSPPPPPRVAVAPAGIRDRGTGRPTKRDRRELERLRGLTEGNRRTRFGGPGGSSDPDAVTGPGGRESSDSPNSSGGAHHPDKGERPDRTRRSGDTGRQGGRGRPGRKG